MEYPYKEILYDSENRKSIDKSNNMDDFQKQYWVKESRYKRAHIARFFLYDYANRQNYLLMSG